MEVKKNPKADLNLRSLFFFPDRHDSHAIYIMASA
jgi:hypothetical protein